MYRYLAFVAVVLVLAVSVQAQVAERGRTPSDGYAVGSPLVTAAASQDHVRFTALALTQKIRLEVLSQTGEPLYDSGLQPGNRLAWQVRDQQGSELRDGLYGCLVTVVDLYGQMSQRRAIFRVKDGAVSFGATNVEPGAAAADDQQNLTILRPEEPLPFTLVSHDGKEGWVESASGGLSFSAGSLSRSRNSVPHLRLTPEGNFGIGVAEPAAKLDVAGVIRASEGFQFSDGTVLKMESGLPVLVPMAYFNSSSATTGTLATSGSLGASQAGSRTIRVLAAGGGVTPRFGNETGSNTWYGDGAGASVTTAINNSFFGQNAGNKTNGTDFFGSDNSFFGWSAGLSNTTGGWNSYFGGSAGYWNTTGSENSFFGKHAGWANTTGRYNSYFGAWAGSQTWGDSNSFFGANVGWWGLTGSENSFFGRGAGIWSASGNSNSFFGAWAGREHITGGWNSFFGDRAGHLNRSGNYNLYLGAGVSGGAAETNTIRIGNPYDGTTQPPSGQNQTFITGIFGNPVNPGLSPSVVGVTSDGRLGTMPGLVSGSLLFLDAGVAPPAGYTLVGSVDLLIRVPDGNGVTKLRFNVYRMN